MRPSLHPSSRLAPQIKGCKTVSGALRIVSPYSLILKIQSFKTIILKQLPLIRNKEFIVGWGGATVVSARVAQKHIGLIDDDRYNHIGLLYPTYFERKSTFHLERDRIATITQKNSHLWPEKKFAYNQREGDRHKLAISLSRQLLPATLYSFP